MTERSESERVELVALADWIERSDYLVTPGIDAFKKIASALRRLAAPDQKPVAYVPLSRCPGNEGAPIWRETRPAGSLNPWAGYECRDLYFSPQPSVMPDHGGADAGVGVKPLEWVCSNDGTWHALECRYKIEPIGKFFRLVRGSTGGSVYVCDADFVESAKDVAQEHHEQHILAALSKPAVDANASAEARLRNHLGIVLSALRMHEEVTGESFDDEGGDIAQIESEYNSLSAHPHASDCARFKHFASDGGKAPIRPDAPDHLTVKTSAEMAHASDCDQQGETVTDGSIQPGDIIGYEADEKTGLGKVTSHVRPSDRTADVKCEALASFIAAKAQVDFGGWETDLARALLDAFKVSRP